MVLGTLRQSFAFHASPESFITSRLQELSSADPDILSSRRQIVRASILNRSVHVISSYHVCNEVLRGQSSSSPTTVSAQNPEEQVRPDAFAVGPAYAQLMSDFFPAPNILLEDGALHAGHKERWTRQLSSFPDDVGPLIKHITETHIRNALPAGARLDLYETLKDLAWKLLLDIVLGLDPADKDFHEIETSQETLLRGQFSLFPVAVNASIWQSARSRGIKARRLLQEKLAQRVRELPPQCPLLKESQIDEDDMSSHCLLFTSSIAVKALSSLLTACVANLFLFPGTTSLAALVRSHAGDDRAALLGSILSETERLSPPVVGVMRRVQQHLAFAGPTPESDGHAVPAGHDVWLYLAGASRDPEVFDDADKFHFDRYMRGEVPPGFALGQGAKTCLGAELVRCIVTTVTQALIDSKIELEGQIEQQGVKGWLGWEANVGSEAIASDLKQLPCQRPREPIMVTVRTS